MKNKKYKVNMFEFIRDVQLLCIALVMINTINVVAQNKFDLLSGGILLSGLAFVGLSLYLRNLKEIK